MNDISSLWERTLGEIKKEISEQAFKTYFENLKTSLDNNKIVIKTDKDLIKKQFQKKYIPRIEQILRDLGGEEIKVEIEIEEEEKKPIQQFLDFNIKRPELKPEFTFQNFVVGPKNEMAYAASRAVAENPGKSYNPLFIYGGVGLGKTHLLHAIAHHILSNNPNMRVIYTTAENFINDIYSALRFQNNLSSVKRKYRSADVLLMDDIQFLSKTEISQEEFFHTFNALYTTNSQLVIASDKPPKELGIEERLKSRFQAGVIVQIQPPDLETRIAILKKKAEISNIEIPEEVIDLIAIQIKGNVRSLEGALNTISIYQKMSKEKLSRATVLSIIKTHAEDKSDEVITIDRVAKAVSKYLGVEIEDLKSSSRRESIKMARMIAMYLATKLTKSTLTEIGKYFNKNHSTVIHARDTIAGKLEEDESLRFLIRDLEENIKIGD